MPNQRIPQVFTLIHEKHLILHIKIKKVLKSYRLQNLSFSYFSYTLRESNLLFYILKINQIFSIKLYSPMNKSVFKFRIML